MESDHGGTSRIYFDNAGDNVTLILHNVMLTSQKSCQHNNEYDCSINEVYFEKYINSIYSADLTFRVIKKMDFNRAELTCKKLIFLTPFPANKIELFRT